MASKFPAIGTSQFSLRATDFNFRRLASTLHTFGFISKEFNDPCREMDFIVRHPDGTNVKAHLNKIVAIRVEYSDRDKCGTFPSNRERFKNHHDAVKSVLFEIGLSKPWPWAGVASCILLICKIRSALLRYRLSRDIHVTDTKPVYAEAAPEELEWRGWGI